MHHRITKRERKNYRMDLAKQYIVQCIITAANNLRLSSAKIEMVAILREHLDNCENLNDEINRMKQITELSKFAIKLGQTHSALVNNKIDFLKISDRFKEDSYSLVKELSNMLDILTPEIIKNKLNVGKTKDISIDFSKRTSNSGSLDNISIKKEHKETEVSKTETQLREDRIFEDIQDKDEFNFERFEETILKEIKYLDAFLNRLANYDYESGEIIEYIKMMKKNAELSDKVGFEILFNMHKIFYRGMELVNEKKIIPSIEVIESMRSCLIVIVAVVRDKDVDITSYLNKAEMFGRSILGKKKEE